MGAGVARGALTVVVLTFFLLATALPAHAASSDLGASFGFDGSRLTATGRLTSDGAPLGGQVVRLSVDGTEVANGTTEENGDFGLGTTVGDATAGSHRAELRFEGADGVDAASATYTFQVERRPQKLQLRVEGPETASNGEVVTLSGSLRTESGTGIANAGISVADRGGEAEDSYTLTNSNGFFETVYTIPEAQPDGPFTLTVSFPGTDQLEAASDTVTIQVDYSEVQPDDPEEDVSPSPTASATSSAAPTPTPTASATPSSEPSPDDGAARSMGWYVVALAAVGLLVVVATAVLILRARTHGAPPEVETTEGLEMFTEDPDSPELSDPTDNIPVPDPDPLVPDQEPPADHAVPDQEPPTDCTGPSQAPSGDDNMSDQKPATDRAVADAEPTADRSAPNLEPGPTDDSALESESDWPQPAPRRGLPPQD
ncbi:MAG: hypothetical protein QM713_07755 [Arachnia sp.]